MVFAGFNSQYRQSKLHCLLEGDKSTPKEIPKRREGMGPKIIEFEYDKVEVLLHKKREAKDFSS